MSECLYAAVIPLNPRTKKNNQRIAYKKQFKKGVGYVDVPFIIQNDKYKEFEASAGWFLTRRPAKPIDVPVTVKVLFYRKDNRRCDLTNLLEAIDDILVKYRILADDNFNIIASHDGSRVYVDKNNPRVEIFISYCKDE